MVSSELTLKRFENLTLDEIYHPILDTIVHSVLATCTIINTIIFPLMIFVIIKSSTKEMELYKHLLVIQIIFSYLFNLITFAWQPSLLWPLRQGYPNTWVDLGPRTVYIFFILEVSFMFNIVVVQLFLVFYRLAATYKKSFWNYIYRDTKVLYSCITGICVSTQIIVIIPICSDEPDPQEVRLLTASEIPIMAKMIEMFPRIAGYHPKYSKGGIDFILILGMVVITLMPILMLSIFIFFVHRLRYVKKNFSLTNYRLQKMLFRSLVIQIVLLIICLLIPAMIFILTIFFEVCWGSLAASGCVVFISFHMSLDSAALIYFIKPYRYYIFTKLRIFKPHPAVLYNSSSNFRRPSHIPKIHVTKY